MYENESDTTEDEQTSTSMRQASSKQTQIQSKTPNIPPSQELPSSPVVEPESPPKAVVAPPRTVSIGATNEPNLRSISIDTQPPRNYNKSGDIHEMMATENTSQSHSAFDTDDYDDAAVEVEGTTFIVLYKFEPEQSGDLSVEIGEEVTLIATRSDGWWRCRKRTGEVGLLPKNVLQHLSPRATDETRRHRRSAPKFMREAPEAHASTAFPEPPPHVIEEQMKRINETMELPGSAPSSHQQQRRKSLISLKDTGLTAKQKEETQMKGMDHLRIARSRNDHYGLVCHLFPRLSESNLYFHDIYWHWNHAQKTFKIRKRKVKVCKLFKVHAIGPEAYLNGFEVNFFLFDKRTSIGRQIVSNIYTANVKVETANSFTLFRHVPNPFVLRSNYNLPEVVLKAQVFHKGDFIGSADIALLNGEGGVVQNGKQFLHIKLDNMEDEPTSCRLVVQILDIPTALVAHADCLPDVLLCNENHVGVFAAYRNLLADYLARRPNPGSAYINDPVLATFPHAACHDFLMQLLIDEVDKGKVLQKDDHVAFRKIYTQTILPLILTLNYGTDEEEEMVMIEKYKSNLKRNTVAIEHLSLTKSRPTDPFNFVVDLASEHALD